MITSLLNKLNINADFDEEEFQHVSDGLQGDHGRQELQERNSYFLKRFKEKFFPVKREDKSQCLMNFLKVLPAGRVADKVNRKRPVRKELKYEVLQLF